MKTPIGFDPASGALAIMGNGVYPARTLTAEAADDGQHVQISSMANRGLQYIAWTNVTSLDGTFTPVSMADALAYLQGEFAKSEPVRPPPAPYPLTGAASFAINHGLSYAPSTTIVDPDGAEVDTDVAHAPGLTTLTFAQPFTGTLYLG